CYYYYVCSVRSPLARSSPHSFPTRRSSDLQSAPASPSPPPRRALAPAPWSSPSPGAAIPSTVCRTPFHTASSLGRWLTSSVHKRSEEHTSELQSRFELVCRLLLENKNEYAS